MKIFLFKMELLDESIDNDDDKYNYFIDKRNQQHQINETEEDRNQLKFLEEEIYKAVEERDQAYDEKIGVSRKPRKNNFNSNKNLADFINKDFVRFQFNKKVFK